MGVQNPAYQVSSQSNWNEDTYHNTLDGVVVSAKKLVPSQTGKKTLLERISGSVNTFFSGIKLPTVEVEHSIGSVAPSSSKTLLYAGIALVAMMVLKKR